jgi:cyclopropane-fatty-acyl-phospholipid synthase
MKAEYSGASADAIQYHYDVGTEFYALWLDKSLTYSCALWDDSDPGDTLETAQIRKIDFHIEQARAKGVGRVLDVGCGWGSVLKRLTERYGVEHAVGLTLSEAQAARVRSFDQPRIDVRLENWSDHSPTEPYDAIISIGAFEHFARLGLSAAKKLDGYRAFFSRCHEWLRPGGWMALQTMAYGNAYPEDANQFIATQIFPESDIPRLAEIAEASERLFEIVALRNDRMEYGRTYRVWLDRLKANRAAAIDQIGEEVVRRWEQYFKLMIVSFEIFGSTNLLRLTLRRIDNPRK